MKRNNISNKNGSHSHHRGHTRLFSSESSRPRRPWADLDPKPTLNLTDQTGTGTKPVRNCEGASSGSDSSKLSLNRPMSGSRPVLLFHEIRTGRFRSRDRHYSHLERSKLPFYPLRTTIDNHVASL